MKTSSTSKRLRQLMEARGLKQVDILSLAAPYCERYGVKLNRSDLSQYVSGKVEPSREKLNVLSQALNVRDPWLMGYGADEAPDALPHPALLPVQRVRIPLLGSASAGEPLGGGEEYDAVIGAGREADCDYAFQVAGDDMEPALCAGDVAFVCRQDDVADGQIAAVLLDGEIALRHVYHQANGLLLISANARKSPPRAVTADELDSIQILGRVVGFDRRI